MLIISISVSTTRLKRDRVLWIVLQCSTFDHVGDSSPRSGPTSCECTKAMQCDFSFPLQTEQITRVFTHIRRCYWKEFVTAPLSCWRRRLFLSLSILMIEKKKYESKAPQLINISNNTLGEGFFSPPSALESFDPRTCRAFLSGHSSDGIVFVIDHQGREKKPIHLQTMRHIPVVEGVVADPFA